MISLHWHLTPRLKFLYVLHELLLLCGKYYILYNIRRSAFGAASSFEMSEHRDEVFQSDSRQGEHPAPALSQDTPSQPNQPKQDLVDTFDLFKTYLDHKLHDLKSDIISEQENLSLKVKEQVNLKFKSEGNKIQFRFNEEIAADLAKLQKHCTSSVNNSLVTDICDKLKSRNKLIRIADTSAGGWATVREYEQNEIADNSDDEKRIRQAENRAIKHIKDKGKFRTTPYSRYSTPARSETRPNPNSNYVRSSTPQPPFRTGFARREPCPWDVCFPCKSMGHWRKNCPLLNRASQNSTTTTYTK